MIRYFAMIVLAGVTFAAHADGCQGETELCGGEWVHNADSCELSPDGTWYGYCSKPGAPNNCQGETELCGGNWVPNADSCELSPDGSWYGYCSKN